MRCSLESPELRHNKPLKNDARKSCCYRAVRIQRDFKLKAVAVSWAKNPIALIPGLGVKTCNCLWSINRLPAGDGA
jgi:hypothetical protein